MKKLSALLFVLLLAGGVYYLNTQSAKLLAQVKTSVNQELNAMQTQGFTIQERQSEEYREHFTLTLMQPQKIAAYLHSRGMQVNRDDIQALKGLTLGVDMEYLRDSYSGISFDLYPLNLPDALVHAPQSPENQKILHQIEGLLAQKTLVTHCDINKLGSGFKGYVKDINETLQAQNPIALALTNFTFAGDIDDGQMRTLSQKIQHLLVDIQTLFSLEMHGLESHYGSTGKTLAEYTINYSLEKMKVTQENLLSSTVDKLSFSSHSSVENNLSNTSVDTTIQHIGILQKHTQTSLDMLHMTLQADNLNLQALEALQEKNPNDTEAMQKALQQLIAHGIALRIPTLSIASITQNGLRTEGFELSSLMMLDKNLDIARTQQNPMLALQAVTATLNLQISPSFFKVLSRTPQVIMAMMFFSPKDINGKKVYDLELKQGKLSINGTPVM